MAVNYTALQTEIIAWSKKSNDPDFVASVPQFITDAEAEMNRKLRVSMMECYTSTPLVPIEGNSGVVANNNALDWIGNNRSVTIALVDPGGNDQSLTFLLDGNNVQISLATGPTGSITSTAAEIISAISSSPDVLDKCSASNTSGSDGSGVVVAETITLTLNERELGIYDLPSNWVHHRTLNKDGDFLRILYLEKIPPLDVNNVNWVLSSHPDLYRFLALSRAEPYLKNDPRFSIWKSQSEEILRDLNNADTFDRKSGSFLRSRVGGRPSNKEDRSIKWLNPRTFFDISQSETTIAQLGYQTYFTVSAQKIRIYPLP